MVTSGHLVNTTTTADIVKEIERERDADDM